MTNVIYTIGHHNLTFDLFIRYVRNYGVRCVVDTRERPDTPTEPIYTSEHLRNELSKSNVRYLSFRDEFGFIPSSCRNSKGKPIYDKVTRQECFQSGLKRLLDGIEKGYSIILLDNTDDLCDSKRYLLLGRALDKLGVNVYHIVHDGTVRSQKEIAEITSVRKKDALEKKLEAAELGKTGEELAALHLMRKGHIILEHNWNLYTGCEIDLITRKDGILHFVEVKTRHSDKRGDPQRAVDAHKIRNISKAIKEYVSRKKLEDMPYQTDIVAIIYQDEEHYTLNMDEDVKVTLSGHY